MSLTEETLKEILNSCFFYFSGSTEEDLSYTGFEEKNIQTGIKLCNFLQEKVK
jgi:hypothetical protein